MSENVGASTSHNPKGLHGLYGDNFTFLHTFTNVKYISNLFKSTFVINPGHFWIIKIELNLVYYTRWNSSVRVVTRLWAA
jgi:hypothetical protein